MTHQLEFILYVVDLFCISDIHNKMTLISGITISLSWLSFRLVDVYFMSPCLCRLRLCLAPLCLSTLSMCVCFRVLVLLMSRSGCV